MEITNKIVQ